MSVVLPQSEPLPAAQKQISQILYPPAYVANSFFDIAIYENDLMGALAHEIIFVI
jgi:hypothetical protein